MCPRSCAKPSETSIAALAIPRKCRPRATRGSGVCRRLAAAALPGRANAYAAPPKQPDTQIPSAGRAPSRRRAFFFGTSPRIVTQMLSGPRVVSPPTSSTPKRRARVKNPFAKPASHRSSAVGSASASVAQRGVAPIAAMSERFTASALWPSLRASAPARKCRPSMSRSVETASSMPAAGRSSAASSPTPSTALRAGRAKYLRIRSNSESKRSDGLPDARDFLRAQLDRQFLEHAVDELVAVGAAEALAQLDRLVEHHLEGRLRPLRQLVGGDQQDDPLHRRERRQAAVQVRRDLAFQELDFPGNRDQQFLGEAAVAALPALQALRLRERVAALHSPGVERLQRELARAAPRRAARGFQRHFSVSSRRRRAISMATRTASAPLSLRSSACASVSVVRMPLATGRPVSSATSMRPRADSLATISKWKVSPRTTAPIAASASKRPDWSTHCTASGSRSAPATATNSASTPAFFSSARADSSSALQISSLKRECTTPMRGVLIAVLVRRSR